MHTFFGISFEFLRFVYWNYIFLEWSLFSISSKFELKVKLWTYKLYIISIFKWKNNDEWQFQKYERCSLFIAVRWKYIVIQIMKIWCALPSLVALIPKLICSIKATKWGRTHQIFIGFLGGSNGKESAGNMGDLGSIPWLGRSPGDGNGNPLQYFWLESPMDRGVLQITPWVQGVSKSWSHLSYWHFHHNSLEVLKSHHNSSSNKFFFIKAIT